MEDHHTENSQQVDDQFMILMNIDRIFNMDDILLVQAVTEQADAEAEDEIS